MRHHKTARRAFALLLMLALALSLSGCVPLQLLMRAHSWQQEQGTAQSAPDNQDFEAFMNNVFKEELQGDAVGLHYTLKNPGSYGLSYEDATLGDISPEALREDLGTADGYLQRLRAFNYDALSAQQQLDYRVLEAYFQIMADLDDPDLLFYDNIIGEIDGLHINFPLNMAEYAFYEDADIDVYLALLAQTDDYFATAEAYLDEQSRLGLFPSDAIADKAIAQIASFTGAPLAQNLLITTFHDRLADVAGLSDAQRAALIAQNEAIVQQDVLPAFTHFSKKIAALKGTGKNQGGVCNLPEGEAYYRRQVRYSTGSARSIEQIQDLLAERFDDLIDDLLDIMSDSPEAYEQLLAMDDFGPTDPEQVLDILYEKAQRDYPHIDPVDYTISDVPAALEENTSPAFYMVPPVDDAANNRIYINHAQTDASSLYATLAHEGYPGHMYQYNYFNATNPHPLRRILNFNGYAEGWGIYVEYDSYENADFYPSEDVAELAQLDAEISVNLSAQMDIGINFLGWDEEDALSFLEGEGYSIGSIGELYTMLTAHPGYYLKYYLGYLEFLALRERAEDALDDAFDAKAFHKVLLDAGPCSFDVLAEQVDSYIHTAAKRGLRPAA
nr:DUF885 domain-containing protein [Maliibacterium massiliense]